MKSQNTPGMGLCRNDVSAFLPFLSQALQAVQISQPLTQDRLALRDVEEIKEGDARKKFSLASGVFWPKIAQQRLQQFDAALRQLVAVTIGLAFLGTTSRFTAPISSKRLSAR